MKLKPKRHFEPKVTVFNADYFLVLENNFVNNDDGFENQQDLDFYCKLPLLLSHFLASGATFQATGVIILISMMNWNFYNRTGGL